MRRTTPPDHAAAVSQRLATLTAELDAVRRERGESPDTGLPPRPARHSDARPAPVAPTPDAAARTPAPVVVPVPGRHASRRPGSAPWAGLADRVPLTGAHLAVLALLVAAGLAVAAWTVLGRQASPEPLAPVTTAAGGSPSGAVAPGSGSTPSPAAQPGPVAPASSAPVPVGTTGEAGEVTVDVAGKVRDPGIAVLPAGSRVADAVEAAGGARRGVDLSSLNLARLLVDGEQVLVGAAPPAPVGAAAAAGSPVTGGTLVNLNTADAAALDTLPGVGPVTAEAILSWRTEHGGFTAVEELLEVDGIGDATLADIAPHVTV